MEWAAEVGGLEVDPRPAPSLIRRNAQDLVRMRAALQKDRVVGRAGHVRAAVSTPTLRQIVHDHGVVRRVQSLPVHVNGERDALAEHPRLTAVRASNKNAPSHVPILHFVADLARDGARAE